MSCHVMSCHATQAQAGTPHSYVSEDSNRDRVLHVNGLASSVGGTGTD